MTDSKELGISLSGERVSAEYIMDDLKRVCSADSRHKDGVDYGCPVCSAGDLIETALKRIEAQAAEIERLKAELERMK